MDEGALASLRRPRSSIAVACHLVRKGDASAVVSAGSTGGVVATAKLRLKTQPGVLRPAIAVALPTVPHPTILLDAGANADAKPEMLVQFAHLGVAYVATALGHDNPRVGLLTIGAEAEKGNKVVKRAHELLEAAPGIRFAGNIEGHDLLSGRVEVIVADGFTGNVALKTMEGSVRYAFGQLRQAVDGSAVARIGGLLQRPRLRGLYERLDPEAHGGAVLLGLNGCVVIAHGSSHAKGVAAACELAAKLAAEGRRRQGRRTHRGHPPLPPVVVLRPAVNRGDGERFRVARLWCMTDPQLVLAERVQQALALAFGQEYAAEDPLIRPSQFADYQANVAMSLAKRLRRGPRDVAQEIAANIDLPGTVEVSGPGFLNLRFHDSWIAAEAGALLADEPARRAEELPAKTVVVDYSAPNAAKEMHVGHLRTTVVGDALVRVQEHLGNRVVEAEPPGRLGNPVRHAHRAPPRHRRGGRGRAARKPATATTTTRPPAPSSTPTPSSTAGPAPAWSPSQAEDPETMRLWRIFMDATVRYFNKVYTQLGVTLTDDDIAGESMYNHALAQVCDELQERGIAEISDGALCVFRPASPGARTSRSRS